MNHQIKLFLSSSSDLMDFYKRYQFNPRTDLLGKGGFSKVYKANDILLDRTVALKFFTGHGFEKYQVLNEIKKVIKFEHSNLCKYYDVAVIDSTNIIGEPETMEVGIMEYLDAGEIKKYLKNNPQDVDKLLIDVLKGLSYLHKRGIVHRDLKPQNIIVKMVDDEPVAKITDFGISKLLSDDDTSASALIGTIEYMAPEQFNPKKYGIGGKITTNLDLWSFGLLVYETVANKPLFGSRSTGNSAEQIMRNILTESFLARTKSLPIKYQTIIDRCLVKNASQRAQSALELIPLFSGNAAFRDARPVVDEVPERIAVVSGEIKNEVLNLDENDSLRDDEFLDPDDETMVADVESQPDESTEQIKSGPLIQKNTREIEIPVENDGDPTQVVNRHSNEIKMPSGDNLSNSRPIYRQIDKNDQKKPLLFEDPKPKPPEKKKWIFYAIIPIVLIIAFFLFRGMSSGAKNPGDGEQTGVTKTTAAEPPILPVPMNDLVKIEGGRFIMGTDKLADSTELPAHAVGLSGFLLNKYEVTLDEFRRFIEATNHVTTAEKEGTSDVNIEGNWSEGANVNWRHDMAGKLWEKDIKNVPVLHVSWEDANKYCEWLSAKNSRHYRLPTEAEWEFAAKGGNNSKHYFFSGSNAIGDVGWYSKNSEYKVHTVGGKQPNELGLFDMSGNVMEWCSDWLDPNYYSESEKENPKGPKSGKGKVVRGGSWSMDELKSFQNSDRSGFPSTVRGAGLGFRICEEK